MAAEEAKKVDVEATKDIAEEKAVVPLPSPPTAAAKLADDNSKAIVAVVKGTNVTSYSTILVRSFSFIPTTRFLLCLLLCTSC